MAPAAETALSTLELLEAVLVHVDIRTLLVSVPRVCSYWRALHASSLPIKRALFMHPDRDAAPPQGHGDSDDEGDEHLRWRVQNPLLLSLFPPWFEFVCTSKPTVSLFRTCGYYYPDPEWYAQPRTVYNRFRELPLYKSSCAAGVDKNPFLRPHASWRKMLISQPPCRTLLVNVCDRIGAVLDFAPSKQQVYHYDDGLRMGELYDLTLRHCSGYLYFDFMTFWFDNVQQNYNGPLRYLKETFPWLPDIFEPNFSRVWDHRPDLVVQMHRQRIRGIDHDLLWEDCGLEVFNVVERRRQVGSAQEHENL